MALCPGSFVRVGCSDPQRLRACPECKLPVKVKGFNALRSTATLVGHAAPEPESESA